MSDTPEVGPLGCLFLIVFALVYGGFMLSAQIKCEKNGGRLVQAIGFPPWTCVPGKVRP
jgi:hypothetical protein